MKQQGNRNRKVTDTLLKKKNHNWDMAPVKFAIKRVVSSIVDSVALS